MLFIEKYKTLYSNHIAYDWKLMLCSVNINRFAGKVALEIQSTAIVRVTSLVVFERILCVQHMYVYQMGRLYQVSFNNHSPILKKSCSK